MAVLLIGLGGAAGAITRYLVDGFIVERTGGGFPWGTLVINLTGSFALGLLFAMTAERAVLPAEVRGPLMIGFLGAYTTFSTFTVETDLLVKDGHVGVAFAYVTGSLVVGLLAAYVGIISIRILPTTRGVSR